MDGGGGSLKANNNEQGEEGQAYLYIRSFKIAWFFKQQTVLSDKLPGCC